MTALEVSLPMEELMTILNRLLEANKNFDLPLVNSILEELPLQYSPMTGSNNGSSIDREAKQ